VAPRLFLGVDPGFVDKLARSRRPRVAQMKAGPGQTPSLRELIALAALAAFGCCLALALGDLLFAFGVASAVTIIDVRGPWAD
jgi:hypothetical protein